VLSIKSGLGVTESYIILVEKLMLGVLFTFNIPTSAQPCENNGHSILGSGKQIFKQSNRCIIVESNIPTIGQPPPTSICGTNSVLQNGVCVPTTTNGVCGTNSVLQNGVCVPTNSSSTTTTGTCLANYILQNGVCVPTITQTPLP
jgi:hypothetical protein